MSLEREGDYIPSNSQHAWLCLGQHVQEMGSGGTEFPPKPKEGSVTEGKASFAERNQHQEATAGWKTS